ncbi:MAG TPA: hypothetical protein VGB69_01170 [Edaphobacter sp.]
MAQGLNSTKTGTRPSHEALEENVHATEADRTEQQKIDDLAMESAKRAQNRIHDDEGTTPGSTIFTK